MQNNVGKEQWIAMFKEIGLVEETMDQWHRLFEQRHPQGHESFLQWLGLPSAEIGRIRANSRL